MYKETLEGQFLGHIFSVSITNDHMYLAFSMNRTNAYVYKYNGSNFNLYQNIALNNTKWKVVQITDDHQHLVLAGGEDNIARIYEHTGSNFT